MLCVLATQTQLTGLAHMAFSRAGWWFAQHPVTQLAGAWAFCCLAYHTLLSTWVCFLPVAVAQVLRAECKRPRPVRQGIERAWDLLGIEAVATLNAAFCALHHRRVCPPSAELQRACTQVRSAQARSMNASPLHSLAFQLRHVTGLALRLGA